MGDSQGKLRTYQLGMAVICTVLASTGFVAAGYADTSHADAAVSLSPQTISRIASTYDEVAAIGFDPVAAQEPDVKMSFAQLYIQSRKEIQSRQPAAQQVLDLTDPNGNTPHLSRGLNAMRGDVPEISLDEISKVRRDILTAAYVGLGHPYVWGGTSFEHGWDCSGFVQWAYAHAGIALPRTEQWVPMVETNNPQPGDIVVQNPDGPYHWSHIGIYVGNGKMISALNPSVGTILHTPAATSSSSTYFTIPAFATADEQAKADAAAKKADGATPTASATPEPTPAKSATAWPTPTKPATTTTTAPTKSATPTAPATTKPATPTPTTPPTTPPATVPPTTVPTTPTPTPTQTKATSPATTAPATTQPPTTPATTQPAPTPSATTQATTAPATTTAAIKSAGPSETPTPSSLTTVSPTAVETTAATKTADQTRTQSTTTETPTAVPSQ